MSEATSENLLSDLQEAELDDETLNALFLDLESLTRIFAVLPKGGATQKIGLSSISLAEAKEGLQQGAFRGVQIRYVYQTEEWWDTLLSLKSGYKLVRIKQEARD